LGQFCEILEIETEGKFGVCEVYENLERDEILWWLTVRMVVCDVGWIIKG